MTLTLSNISKSYGNLKVLDNFSLELSTGITALLAPSGSGKTTLLRIISGLESPDMGTISYPENHKISVVFQEDRLFPTLTAMENILLPSENSNKPLATSLIGRIGLASWENAYPNELSGGMSRRISFVRALVYGGSILLLDEPFKGLDEENKAYVLQLIKQYSKDSIVLLITHSKEDILSCANVIIEASTLPMKINNFYHSK